MAKTNKRQARQRERLKAAAPKVDVHVKAKFPDSSIECPSCCAIALVATGKPGEGSCLNCGITTGRKSAWTVHQENVRAAEAGKAHLPLPMPLQFTARELSALQAMISHSAHVHNALNDKVGLAMCESMHNKAFEAMRAWWDDAEKSTAMKNAIIERFVNQAEKKEEVKL